MILVQFTCLKLIILGFFLVDISENCVKQLLAAPRRFVDGVKAFLLSVTAGQGIIRSSLLATSASQASLF